MRATGLFSMGSLWAGFTLLVASCATQVAELRAPTAELPVTKRVTVAVLPFDSEVDGEDSEFSSAEIVEFERYYFPARLVSKLRQSAWIREAYAAPVSVRSVDYVLRGTILHSDAETTKLQIAAERIDGVEAVVETFAIDVSGVAEASQGDDPTDPTWIAVTNWVTSLADEMTPDERRRIEVARLGYYAERKVADSDALPGALTLVSDVAEIERRQLLGPATKVIGAQADVAGAQYSQWRRETAVLAANARSERRQAAAKTVMAVLLVAAAGAQQVSAAQAGLATTPDANYHQAVHTSQKLLTDAGAHSNKAGTIAASGAEMTAAFSQATATTSVTVADGVYTLAGSIDAQLAQLREIAGAKLRIELGL